VNRLGFGDRVEGVKSLSEPTSYAIAPCHFV